jgi:hypothetical protein
MQDNKCKLQLLAVLHYVIQLIITLFQYLVHLFHLDRLVHLFHLDHLVHLVKKRTNIWLIWFIRSPQKISGELL